MTTATPTHPSNMDLYVRTTEATDRLVRSVLATPAPAVQPTPEVLGTELLTVADLPEILWEFSDALDLPADCDRQQQKAALVGAINQHHLAGCCKEQAGWMMPRIEAVVAL